jgi:hypothetical protein
MVGGETRSLSWSEPVSAVSRWTAEEGERKSESKDDWEGEWEWPLTVVGVTAGVEDGERDVRGGDFAGVVENSDSGQC